MIVSVCLITYNHEKYIRQAIESVVRQQVNFSLELVIGDDHSQDSTQKICMEYAAQFPAIIRVLRSESNQGSIANFIRTYDTCNGKYIAMLSGDDYWIDDHKLQKQVDALEMNSAYALSFSSFRILNETVKKESNKLLKASDVTMQDLIRQNLFTAATCVLVKKFFSPVPVWFKEMPFEDWSLYLYVLHQHRKKIHILQEITTVYRVHGASIHGSLSLSNAGRIKAYMQDIEFYNKIRQYIFKDKFDKLIEDCIQVRQRNISMLHDNKVDPVLVMEAIQSYIPPDSKYIFVDEDKMNFLDMHMNRNIPFTEKDGDYNGAPIDDETAVYELKNQMARGVNYIIFHFYAFWWLDYYTRLKEYLNDHAELIINTDSLKGYRLKTESH